MNRHIFWHDLALADAELTSKYIDSDGKVSHKIVSDLSLKNQSGFSHLKNEIEKEYVLSLLNVEYRALSSNFKMDNGFTSFGVFAKKRFVKGDVVPVLVGFLAPIKECEIVEGVNDVSVFRHHTGSKIMLGGVSFINSSCRENCTYVGNSKRTKVSIRVISRNGLFPGDEITVLYSGDYFGPNRVHCECPFSEMHGKEHPIQSWTRSGKVRSLSTVSERLVTSTTEQRALQKLRRRHRDVGPTYQPRRIKKSRYRVRYETSSESSSSITASPDISENESLGISSEANLFFDNVREKECSTPNRIDFISDNDEELLEPIGSQGDHSDDERRERSNMTSSSEIEEMICLGSSLTTRSFCSELIELADIHNLPERGLGAVLSLFRKALPAANNLPSLYSLRQQEISSLSGLSETQLPEGLLYDLNFERQLSHLLSENFDLVSTEGYQLQTDLCLPKSNKFCLYFALSTDGVSPFNSAKFSLYPVWLMLLNLPARRRVSYRNLLLVSLFGGEKKPHCENLMKHTVKILSGFSSPKVLQINGSSYTFTVKLKYVIVDMVMKAPLVNQTQFNGRYGCTNCLAVGQRALAKDTWIYPFHEPDVSQRTSKERQLILECLGSECRSLYGLRGNISDLFFLPLLHSSSLRTFSHCFFPRVP